MIIDGYDIKIKVNLNPGVYKFTNFSSTGKSKLYHILKRYRSFGENVLGYSYEDYMSGFNLNEALKTRPRLIVIDRYDMYKGTLDKEIAELGKTGIVLIDCKSGLNISYRTCPILMKSSRDIEVGVGDIL